MRTPRIASRVRRGSRAWKRRMDSEGSDSERPAQRLIHTQREAASHRCIVRCNGSGHVTRPYGCGAHEPSLLDAPASAAPRAPAVWSGDHECALRRRLGCVPGAPAQGRARSQAIHGVSSLTASVPQFYGRAAALAIWRGPRHPRRRTHFGKRQRRGAWPCGGIADHSIRACCAML